MALTLFGGHLATENVHHAKTTSGFTPEFKDEAVRLVINAGRPVAVVACELGIQESTLGRWVKVFRARHDAGDAVLSETERAFLKNSVPLQRLRKLGYEQEAFVLTHAGKSTITF